MYLTPAWTHWLFTSTLKALFYAAQASNAYDVTKFLLDHKCNLNQENIANLQPIHALLANDKLSAREIVDTIGLYRINGHEANGIDTEQFWFVLARILIV